MKKNILVFAGLLLCLLSGCDTLKQVSSTLDQISSIGSSSGSSQITTPHRNLQVNLQSCEASGDKVVIEFLLVNHGETIKDYRLSNGTSGNDKSKIFDDLGNQCFFRIAFGNSEDHGGTAQNTLSTDVPIKVKMYVYNVSAKATRFSQVTIYGQSYDYPSAPFSANGDFVLKNVAIQR